MDEGGSENRAQLRGRARAEAHIMPPEPRETASPLGARGHWEPPRHHCLGTPFHREEKGESSRNWSTWSPLKKQCWQELAEEERLSAGPSTCPAHRNCKSSCLVSKKYGFLSFFPLYKAAYHLVSIRLSSISQLYSYLRVQLGISLFTIAHPRPELAPPKNREHSPGPLDSAAGLA